MTKEVEKLQELIDNHDNIVFFGGAGVWSQQKAASRISGAKTGCIIWNTNIHQRQS